MAEPWSDPERSARDRVLTLEAYARGLSPMHPRTWESMRDEHDGIVRDAGGTCPLSGRRLLPCPFCR